MKTVAQGSMAEVKLGKLALQKASSADVKNVAQTIVTDHSKANASLMQVAKKDHYALPKDIDAQHKAAYAKLSRLSGAAFDKAYIAGQVKDHDKTVALFKKQMQVTQEPNLKTFETDYLPKIQQHTDMLHQIQQGGGKGTMKGGAGSMGGGAM
jgi:putative membrane protein